jgi:hypothetical protein
LRLSPSLPARNGIGRLPTRRWDLFGGVDHRILDSAMVSGGNYSVDSRDPGAQLAERCASVRRIDRGGRCLKTPGYRRKRRAHLFERFLGQEEQRIFWQPRVGRRLLQVIKNCSELSLCGDLPSCGLFGGGESIPLRNISNSGRDGRRTFDGTAWRVSRKPFGQIRKGRAGDVGEFGKRIYVCRFTSILSLCKYSLSVKDKPSIRLA